LTLLLACVMALASPVFAKELRFAQAQTLGYPLLTLEHLPGATMVKGGLLVELQEAIAKELGFTTITTALPRLRLEEHLQQGKEHVLCYADPLWLKQPDKLMWSQVFLSNSNLIVMQPGLPLPKSLADIPSGRVGTVFGYVYPELDFLFQSSVLMREDALNDESNFKKFRFGRMDYLVTHKLFLDATLRNEPDAKGLIGNTLTIRRYDTRCALSKLAPVSPAQFDAAMGRVKKRGEFEAILANYR
jgi:polar amino acid transport system substrate-binding protein